MATTASANQKQAPSKETRPVSGPPTMKAIAVLPGQPNTMHLKKSPAYGG